MGEEHGRTNASISVTAATAPPSIPSIAARQTSQPWSEKVVNSVLWRAA
jgi:hypothetical protein